MDPHRVWASRSSLPQSQAVEFAVKIGEYRGVVRVPRRGRRRLLPERPSGTSAGASWPRTGNVEICGRDHDSALFLKLRFSSR